jgi:hypothetical protein
MRGMATDGLAKPLHGSNVLDASRKCKIISRFCHSCVLTVGATSWSIRIRTALCEDLHAGGSGVHVQQHDTTRYDAMR